MVSNGTVKLFGVGWPADMVRPFGGWSGVSCCELRASDLGPDLECLGAGNSEVGNGSVVSAKVEEVGDRIMDGEEALDLASRPEPLHLPFSSPRRLVGVRSSVVDAFVLAVLDPWHDVSLGGGVALQLVCHHDPRRPALPLQ